MQFPRRIKTPGAAYGAWQVTHNPGKNDQGYSVSNPLFCNSFTKPHQKRGARCKCNNRHEDKTPSGI